MANNSGRVILITDNNRNENAMRNALATRPVELATGYQHLYSVDSIRTTINKTRNSSFLRAELFNFIRSHGMPYFLGLDYTINLDLDDALDPDKRKILRTFLISSIILSRGTGFENMRANFLLFAEPGKVEEARSLIKRPSTLLSMLHTRDEKVNRIINTMKENSTLFNRIFYIDCIDNSLAPTQKENAIREFAEAIDRRLELEASIAGRMKTKVEKSPGGPARVVMKLDDGNVIADGHEIPLEKIGKYKSFNPQEIYVVGDWTNVNIRSVAEKIAAFIKKGFNDFRFSTDEQIILHLGKMCTIDGATATSLAQLLVNQLHEYKITLMVSPENQRILEKSNGYSMIRSYVTYSS